MAELDYAFLAEYADASTGKLTSVGASYTHVTTPGLPVQHMLAIAGRIRAQVDEPPVELRVTVKAPNDGYEMGLTAELSPDERARPYGNKVGILWAMNLTVVLPTEGLYEVLIDVSGERARRLAFDVAVGTRPES